MSARKEAKQAPLLQRIGSRWTKQLAEAQADADRISAKHVADLWPELYAPTDAPASGRATGDAAGAPHGRIVDTERDA